MNTTLRVLAVYCLHSGLARALTCHCLDNKTCNEVNGFCQNGCEKGWYGPGCQVGNLALGKPAAQSTTFNDGFGNTADMAVDGLIPEIGDTKTPYCSHTAETSGTSWWYVTLSSTEVFVIQNITIVRRQGDPHDFCLSNFYILYTNDSVEPPDTSLWKLCHYQQNHQATTQYTYQCSSMAVGRKVGISIQNSGCTQKLMLCEVYIYGYSANACPGGFTGPGCLLRSCEPSCSSLPSLPCDIYGGCQFFQCPDKTSLPPGCWIKTENFSSTIMSLTATCDTINLSLDSSIGSADLAATSVVISTYTFDDSQVQTEQIVLKDSRTVRVSLPGSTNKTYSVWATPVTCLNKSNCLSGMPEVCSAPVSCIYGPSTKNFTIQTGYRSYFLKFNDTCVTVTTNSSNKDCEYPATVEVNCQGFETKLNDSVGSFENVTCGLKPGTRYNCSIAAKMSTGLVETYYEYLLTNKKYEIFSEAPKASEESIGSIIGGVLGGFVILVGLVVSAFIILRRMNFKFPSSDMNISLTSSSNLILENGKTGNELHPNAEVGEATYGNTVGMDAEEFAIYIKDKTLIEKRFKELASNEGHPTLTGLQSGNASRNRFKNIIPYDYNRVVLKDREDSYINASYINGYSTTEKYIATQGPSAATVDHFWSMVWQEKATTIVMLTDFVENSKKKCEQYFPRLGNGKHQIEVTVQSTTTYDTHKISILLVKKGKEKRHVSHFHYLSWLDHSIPEHLGDILLFYTKIHSLGSNRQCPHGPLIVHCSAGAGRTGAWIALDYLIERFIDIRRVDVDSCVLQLRDQRMKMVQTKEQFVFLHRAVMYAMKTLRFAFDGSNLETYNKELLTPAAIGDKLLQEWEVLQSCSNFPSDDYSASISVENSKERKRPSIQPLQDVPSEYMNAAFCNGCYSSRGFIAAQWPMPDTVTKFWQTVYQVHSRCIIVLHEKPHGEDYPIYWPAQGSSITAGPFLVSNLAKENTKEKGSCDRGYQEFELTLQFSETSTTEKKEERQATMFLLDLFSCDSELPTNALGLLSFARSLTTMCKSSRDHPIIVQCRDGASHCGLFMAAVNSLQRLAESNQVQVFHSVDRLRSSREQFVRSIEQYRFIYEFIQMYRENS